MYDLIPLLCVRYASARWRAENQSWRPELSVEDIVQHSKGRRDPEKNRCEQRNFVLLLLRSMHLLVVLTTLICTIHSLHVWLWINPLPISLPNFHTESPPHRYRQYFVEYRRKLKGIEKRTAKRQGRGRRASAKKPEADDPWEVSTSEEIEEDGEEDTDDDMARMRPPRRRVHPKCCGAILHRQVGIEQPADPRL